MTKLVNNAATVTVTEKKGMKTASFHFVELGETTLSIKGNISTPTTANISTLLKSKMTKYYGSVNKEGYLIISVVYKDYELGKLFMLPKNTIDEESTRKEIKSVTNSMVKLLKMYPTVALNGSSAEPIDLFG